MKDYYFICNPISRGGRNLKLIQELKAWASEHLSHFRMVFTEFQGHAIALADKAARQGYQNIISVGGDGTFNELVNGVLQSKAKQSPGLGMISSGTGGDLVRSLHEDFMLPDAFSWLLSPQRVAIDLGLVEATMPRSKKLKRYFVNIADVGLSGEVTRRVNLTSKRLGALEYLLSTLVSVLHYQVPEFKLTLFQKKKKALQRQLKLLALIMANGRYFGGGMCIAPQASLQDGLFEVLLVEEIPYLEILRELPKVYLKKKFQHPKVHYYQCHKLNLESLQGTLPLDMDGETFSVKELTMQVIPRGLEILVP